MEKKIANVQFNFRQFMALFPTAELPMTISEEDAREYSQANEPISAALLEAYIIRYDDMVDEFTEYVPCFSFKTDKKFWACIYWKAGLLEYEYVLATYTLLGALIDKKTISATRADGDKLIRSVATIEPSLSIINVEGASNVHDKMYIADDSKASRWEIQEDGRITL